MIELLNKDEVENRDKKMKPMYSKNVDKKRALFKTASSNQTHRSNSTIKSKVSEGSLPSSRRLHNIHHDHLKLHL